MFKNYVKEITRKSLLSNVNALYLRLIGFIWLVFDVTLRRFWSGYEELLQYSIRFCCSLLSHLKLFGDELLLGFAASLDRSCTYLRRSFQTFGVRRCAHSHNVSIKGCHLFDSCNHRCVDLFARVPRIQIRTDAMWRQISIKWSQSIASTMHWR